MIDDVEAWFEYLEARNLTSHTYNQVTAEENYEVTKDFLNDALKLISELENRLSSEDKA